MKLMLKCQ